MRWRWWYCFAACVREKGIRREKGKQGVGLTRFDRGGFIYKHWARFGCWAWGVYLLGYLDLRFWI